MDAILTPATSLGGLGIAEMADADPVQMYLNDVFTVTVNMAVRPALPLPGGTDSTGLPLGLQLIGRPFDEKTLFSLGGDPRSGRPAGRTALVVNMLRILGRTTPSMFARCSGSARNLAFPIRVRIGAVVSARRVRRSF